MPRQPWTAEQKAHAQAAYVEHGPHEASRQTGIPVGTISSWAKREGWQTVATEQTAAATAAAMVALEERKARLAFDLMDDVQRLRAELFSPCVERKPVVVSDGARVGSHVEIVDVDLSQPSFSEQKAIMTTIAIAVDKVQILTGAATERIDHTGLPIDREKAENELATILDMASRRRTS